MQKKLAISVGISISWALISFLFIQLPHGVAGQSDPEFTLKSFGKTVTYKRSQLLARKDVTQLEMDYDPISPGKKVRYQVVPVYALLEGIKIPEESTIHYVCSDGFAAALPRQVLLNRSSKRAVAFLAIETDSDKWPRIDPSKAETAGPYYLVWRDPQASGISREGWPYHVTGFEVKESMKATYPKIYPDSKLPENHPVSRGFKLFTKNCFACHTMNRQGDGTLGPDLNVPMNPTEYLKPNALRLYVRNPQSLRYYPGSRMHAFPKEMLSDSDLTDVISYLSHMSRRKVSGPAAPATPATQAK